MNVQEELRELATKIGVAQQQKTRAEIELETSTARRNETVKALKEEFGVSTGADITAKVKELEEALAAHVAEVRTTLEEAGA
jgi:adenylyl- and sulfurtransferase ThiI